ncbi:hypothetical protein [Parachlamydia sp. AcF125]|uniref:hypothetical protein n=1 Tax=Parachlamydia sp. AcF125 TaxID=2795736 RepID=UPI001BC9E49F|nr:hypothetical protein [Parachlamydia sp. AcF125]MBS4167950.1 hypothetical protein [Parachlamydia sp. AcF125]
MSIIKATSHLVTNHENWHLEYHDKPAVPLAQVVKRCFLSVFIVSPFFLAVSPFLLPLGVTAFCLEKKRQKRTMAILEDITRLESYKKARLEKYKNKIAIFEKKALPFLEKNSLGSLVNLPTYFREWDEDKKRVYWKKFSQINFYQNYLSQKKFREEFEKLEKIQKEMPVWEDTTPLESYKKARLEKYKNKIAIFEKKALPFLEKKSLGSLVNLPTYFREWDEDKKRVYWKKFSQINFYQNYLSQKKFREEFEKLEKIQKKMTIVEKQNAILPSDDNNEAIQKILELKAVKNKFKLMRATENLKLFICAMLPLGFLFSPLGKGRSLFKGKKELLPQLPLFDKYADLVEAHNQLIERHECLVPLLIKPFKLQA